MERVETVPAGSRGSPERERALIVGEGETAARVAETLELRPELGLRPVGPVGSVPAAELRALIREHAAGRVVLASGADPCEETAALLGALHGLDVEIDLAPEFDRPVAALISARSVDGVPLFALRTVRLSRSGQVVKRGFDVVVSALALLAVSPLLAAITAWIKLDSPGPVFFRQDRIGFRNRRFQVYKFRTMALDADERKEELSHLNTHALHGGDPRLFKIAGDPRVTRVGRFLRRYFLDELPQLINVLKGEMSLVGPRPLIPEEDRHVAEWARRRLDLRPGMTGLWQVLGHSAISFDEMLRLDYLYVTTWSVRNDVRLLARTVPVVLRGGGGSF